mmetsp:Transcript_2537/g.9853  ORF Transcript_2537/g.9853 Transcript_2537/m.9853 type:complete len:264 (+) Transcript_2537:1994-2785(+)
MQFRQKQCSHAFNSPNRRSAKRGFSTTTSKHTTHSKFCEASSRATSASSASASSSALSSTPSSTNESSRPMPKSSCVCRYRCPSPSSDTQFPPSSKNPHASSPAPLGPSLVSPNSSSSSGNCAAKNSLAPSPSSSNDTQFPCSSTYPQSSSSSSPYSYSAPFAFAFAFPRVPPGANAVALADIPRPAPVASVTRLNALATSLAPASLAPCAYLHRSPNVHPPGASTNLHRSRVSVDARALALALASASCENRHDAPFRHAPAR